MVVTSPIVAPTDAPPAFDFWGWRMLRRDNVDLLLAMALATEDGALARLLRAAADGMEEETLDDATLAELLAWVSPDGAVRTNAELHAALLERLPRGARIEEHVDRYGVEPDWEAIVRHPRHNLFVGTIGIFDLRARLVPTTAAVPEYTVIWLADGEFLPESGSPLRLHHARVGRYLDEGPTAWDWLLTRRLQMLCERGIMPWPAADSDPLHLDLGSWRRIPSAI